MRAKILFTMLVAITAASPLKSTCLKPAPEEDFTNANYNGSWYEIGKIQTKGGAFFQEGCMCDFTEVTMENEIEGNGTVTYTCRRDSVDAAEESFTAILLYDGTPGRFQQRYTYAFSPSLSYNVVYLDEDFAIEYDCGTSFGITNYCVHFMSRWPTMEADKLNDLMEIVDDLGLNTQNLPYEAINQDGCW